MSYLVDTNVWLEVLLGQSQQAEAAEFLRRVPRKELAITQFAIYSIAVLLARKQLDSALTSFVQDITTPVPIDVVRIPDSELPAALGQGRSLGLDFDDAYQYAAAEKWNLGIVSFDQDFDKTPRGRLTPSQAIALLPPTP